MHPCEFVARAQTRPGSLDIFAHREDARRRSPTMTAAHYALSDAGEERLKLSLVNGELSDGAQFLGRGQPTNVLRGRIGPLWLDVSPNFPSIHAWFSQPEILSQLADIDAKVFRKSWICLSRLSKHGTGTPSHDVCAVPDATQSQGIQRIST